MPLYGDMMIGPFQFIQRTPNYAPDKWPSCNSSKESAQANLLKHLPAVRAEYIALMSELALTGSHNDMYERVTRTKVQPESKVMDDAAYYDLARRTLHTLSAWTSRITELVRACWIVFIIDVLLHVHVNAPVFSRIYKTRTCNRTGVRLA